jgi:cell division protein YceG involved in septum cleavage
LILNATLSSPPHAAAVRADGAPRLAGGAGRGAVALYQKPDGLLVPDSYHFDILNQDKILLKNIF